MTIHLQPQVVDRLTLYKQQHEQAMAESKHFDPLETTLRGEFEVCAYNDRWGVEWVLSGGTGINFKMSRRSGRHEPVVERDKMDLRQEITAAEKYYLEWLKGEHNEATRIQDPVTLRINQQKVMQAVALGTAYDPHNPVASIGLKPNPGPMNWGDRAGYVPSPSQKAKRDTIEKNVRSALAERRYSMDTIATAAECSRDYVREISKHFCTPEEHKENLKREDS
jgi:hypothetical protein